MDGAVSTDNTTVVTNGIGESPKLAAETTKASVEVASSPAKLVRPDSNGSAEITVNGEAEVSPSPKNEKTHSPMLNGDLKHEINGGTLTNKSFKMRIV